MTQEALSYELKAAVLFRIFCNEKEYVCYLIVQSKCHTNIKQR